MTGYVRNDVTDQIANGNTIDAVPLDGEFNGLQTAFAAVGGHKHSGAIGEGAPITVVGPTQDVVVSANSVTPKTTNTVDLGSATLKWKDLFVVGASTLAAVSGTTFDGTVFTGTSFVGPLTGSVTGNVTGDVVGNASTASALQTARTITLTGGVTGVVAFDGSANVNLAATVTNGSHTHTLANITDSGTIASQNANAVSITGGSVAGITDLAVADGGTGASTAANARTNLGIVFSTQAEAEGGSNGTTYMTPQRTKQAITFNAPKIYRASALGYDFTAGGSRTLTHGLGDVPDFITYRMICKAAPPGGSGYSIGDIVDIPVGVGDPSGPYGLASVVTASTITLYYGAGGGITYVDTSGDSFLLSPSSWRISVIAGLFT